MKNINGSIKRLILVSVLVLYIWSMFLTTRWMMAGRFDDSVVFNCLVDFCRFYLWQ